MCVCLAIPSSGLDWAAPHANRPLRYTCLCVYTLMRHLKNLRPADQRAVFGHTVTASDLKMLDVEYAFVDA